MPVVAFVGAVTAAATGRRELMQPLVLVSVVLAPVLLPRTMLYPDPDPPPSISDGDDDDGGHGPGPGPLLPAGPRGGIPLPDADPARIRVRSHRSVLTRQCPRRSTSEPGRVPTRAPHRA